MRPALFIGGALVTVAVAAAVVVIVGGGADDTVAENSEVAARPAAPTAIDRPATDVVAAAPATAPAAAAGVRADAEFEAWAAPLRAAGLDVSADSVVAQGGEMVATGLAIAGPESARGWRWFAETAVLGDAAGATSIRSTGAQTLALGDLDLTLGGTMAITVERGADDVVTALSFEANSLSVAQGDGPPTRVGQLSLRLSPGDSGVAGGSRTSVQLRATDVVLPGAERSALGPEIDLVAADIDIDRSATALHWADVLGALSAPASQRLASIELRWGVVDATGEGTMGLDAEGRLAGTLSLAVPEPLTVLDAFHAAAPFDRAALAQFYAALLAELGPDPAAALPFVVDLEGGRAVLRGASRDADDLVLGGIPPFLAPG